MFLDKRTIPAGEDVNYIFDISYVAKDQTVESAQENETVTTHLASSPYYHCTSCIIVDEERYRGHEIENIIDIKYSQKQRLDCIFDEPMPKRHCCTRSVPYILAVSMIATFGIIFWSVYLLDHDYIGIPITAGFVIAFCILLKILGKYCTPLIMNLECMKRKYPRSEESITESEYDLFIEKLNVGYMKEHGTNVVVQKEMELEGLNENQTTNN